MAAGEEVRNPAPRINNPRTRLRGGASTKLDPRQYAKQRFKTNRVLEQAHVTEKLTAKKAGQGYRF
jgi:hypothetical protein